MTPRKTRSLVPWIALAAGLAVTVLATRLAMRAEESKSRLQFQFAVEKTARSVEACLRHHIMLLRAGDLFFSAGHGADAAAQLKAYAAEVELRQAFPGAQSLGLCLRFSREEKARMDRDRSPGAVRVWPDFARPVYFAVTAIEPADEQNRPALGFDFFTDPVCGAAMLAACDSGLPIATARVRLRSETGVNPQPAFLVFSPLYRNGRPPATPTQRQTELSGFAFCAFRVSDLIASAVDPKAIQPVGIQIFDTAGAPPKSPLYSSPGVLHESPPRFHTAQILAFAGRSWRIEFSSRPEYESAPTRALIPGIPVLGGLFSVLLFFFLRMEEQARLTAERQSAELARSESLLRQSDRRNRILVDKAPVIIWESDAEGNCVFVNQTGIQFCGRPTARLRDGRWQVLAHPEDRHALLATADAARRAQREFQLKCRFRCASGQYRWLWLSASPVQREEDDLYMGYLGSAIDITEQENSQEWLRASEELYRMIACASDLGALTLAAGGAILSANELAHSILGCPGGGLPGKNLFELVPDMAQNAEVRDYFKAARPGSVCKDMPLSVSRPDGSEVSIELSLACALKEGSPLIIAVARDISRRKRVQSAMLHAQKMQAIGALAGGIAHDFNNVFTAILSHLDLAVSAGNEPGRADEHLDYVRTSASRGAELVKRLLAFSRQSAPQIRRLDLAELLKDTTALLQRSITRRIQFTADIQPGLWDIQGDESQVKQVIINLCLNARDAMPEGGALSVSASNQTLQPADMVPPRRAGDFARVTVSDTGAGMNKQAMDRLFEPYFTTKEFGAGAGLGLSIGNSIVAEHGGWIEVESEPRRGSRFHVFLPRRLSAPEEPAPCLAAPSALSRSKSALEGTETILIADDDYMVRNLIRAVLAYRGYKMIESADGEEALQKALSTAEPPNLVLLDVEMPKRNGWEVLKELQRLRPEIKVILCTGEDASESAVDEAKAAGAARVLGKPFTNPELLRAVRETLDAPQDRPAPPSPQPSP